MKKICKDCGKEFENNDRRLRCGSCHYYRYAKKYQTEYLKRPETKEKISQNRKNRRDEKYKLVRDIKTESGCHDCGITDWRVLEFHHNGDKEDGISYLVSGNLSTKRILKEIEKCSVLCANCHKLRHWADA